MKGNWRRYRASKPGRRFQDRYRRQESEHGWQDPRKLFYVVGGLSIALGSPSRSAASCSECSLVRVR